MRAGPWLVASLLAVSAAGVARTQPRLAATVHDVKERSDVYTLPPPSQLHAFVLGYDAAAVDGLWATLLVQYGMHWHERRPFHPDPYIDTILELEPSYRLVYRFAETLLCYRPLHATAADARKTHDILVRGTRERPGDYEMWIVYGQFCAFLGPGYLEKNAPFSEIEKWRVEGALALTHAAELGGGAHLALVAASLLGKAGDRDAAIASLRKQLMVTEDERDRADILAKLGNLEATAQADTIQHNLSVIEGPWKKDWPFLTRWQFMMLNPEPDPALCAGPQSSDDPACARDWDEVLAGSAR